MIDLSHATQMKRNYFIVVVLLFYSFSLNFMSIPNSFTGICKDSEEKENCHATLLIEPLCMEIASHYGKHNTFCSIVIKLSNMSMFLPLYSLSDDELLWIFSMKSSAILDASLPVSCVGWPLLE